MKKRSIISSSAFLILSVVLFQACSSVKKEGEKKIVIPKAISTVSASPKKGLTRKSSLSINVSISADSVKLDSISTTWEQKKLKTSTSSSFSIPLASLSLGRQEIKTTVYLSNGKKENHYLRVTLLAENPPKAYTYRTLATYTHDPEAYTQGLLFHDGFLYESTGQNGTSSLRKVEISSGKVLQQINVDDKYFGEGLALWKDQLIQLTWTSNIGFVYNLETFKQVRTFNYPTEGWGITNYHDLLVMSDGTEYLYFLDPNTFNEKYRLQVFDDKGKVNNLNELELIDGMIYANVYKSDYIVIINPENGEVTGKINLEGILNKRGYNRPLDVLNGIAWDDKDHKLYVTGKWWPKLFEIEIIPVQQ